ncbi:MAG: hypothetical protein IJ412_09640 [Oscillospiraceae bacterium]|nr:hypothetical protein [Oscillospiraceae bacterium]
MKKPPGSVFFLIVADFTKKNEGKVQLCRENLPTFYNLARKSPLFPLPGGKCPVKTRGIRQPRRRQRFAGKRMRTALPAARPRSLSAYKKILQKLSNIPLARSAFARYNEIIQVKLPEGSLSERYRKEEKEV